MESSDTLSELLAAATRHFNDARPLFPMYAHLVASALFPIFTGSYASLSRPTSAAKPAKKRKTADDDDDEEAEEDAEEQAQKMEGLRPQDAIIFPVTAAIALGSLYFLIKRYGADAVNLILGWYFAAVGIFSVGRLINDAACIVITCLFPTYFGDVKGRLWKVNGRKREAVVQGKTKTTIKSNSPFSIGTSFPTFMANRIWGLRTMLKQKYETTVFIHELIDFKGKLTVVNFSSAALGLASIIFANYGGKLWFLTNLQGFAVCYSALQFMSPTSFTTGSLILMSLFCYDIWAVFFTPLMVTVATNIDQPIKLLFPRPDEPSDVPGEPPIKTFSMLGLGDIVLPGLMIGLALRFDLYMFYLKKQKLKKTKAKSGSESAETIEKAEYVPVTGQWGDRLWTSLLPKSSRPSHLDTSFPKPYFNASIIGYIVGMITTLGVMSIFHHAQPALLYLVPGVLISVWGAGLVRGELTEMWNFSEGITAEQIEDGSDSTENDGKKDDESWVRYLWREIFGGSEEKKSEDDAKKDSDSEKDKSETDKIFEFSVSRCGSGSSRSRRNEEPKSSTQKDDTKALVSGVMDESTEQGTPTRRTRSTKKSKNV